MIVSKSFLKELEVEYQEKNKDNPKDNNIKKVAFYDKKKMIPAEYEGMEDMPFVFKEDTLVDGKMYKKGDYLYQLYIRITNSKDKFSIYDQKEKEIIFKGRPRRQREIFKRAYEKYLKFKENNCKNKEELEKDKLLRDSLDKDKQMEELKLKLANAQAEKLKFEEIVNANSLTNKKVKENDATDDKPKHSKGRKN